MVYVGLALKYIYSYLTNRKQCVKINNTHSSQQNIVSGVPQGSIVGPILFNVFLNDFFQFFNKVPVHNFADDNTLSSSSDTYCSLIDTLKSESGIAIDWFFANKMIVNPDKFKSIIIQKHKSPHEINAFQIGNNSVEITSSVKLLGISLDNQQTSLVILKIFVNLLLIN